MYCYRANNYCGGRAGSRISTSTNINSTYVTGQRVHSDHCHVVYELMKSEGTLLLKNEVYRVARSVGPI